MLVVEDCVGENYDFTCILTEDRINLSTTTLIFEE
jgi:hypothetical protein